MEIYNLKYILLVFLIGSFTACEIEDLPDPNNLGVAQVVDGASLSLIQNVVDGIESGMRDRLGTYLDGVGVIGREYYRFSASDPRFTTDLLGGENSVLDNNTFYTTNPFSSRYRVIKNANILIEAIDNTSADITAEEVSATKGFANTIIAYQLLLVLNQQYNNGVRVDVADPDNLGPFLDLNASLSGIRSLLDTGHEDLAKGGGSFPFSLTSGFAGFDTPTGVDQFNRGLAARVALYQEDWDGALNALADSFLDIDGDFDAGVAHPFSTAGGDLTNPMWFPVDQAGETRVVHPSMVADLEAGDARASKFTERTTPAFLDNLESNYDVTIYALQTDAMFMMRNEELILISAEANAQLGNTDEAIAAVNKIRATHGLADYAGDNSQSALIDQILHERRYSLYGEGHRWVDMRRYGKLGELTLDRPADDVWEQFPRPATEN